MSVREALTVKIAINQMYGTIESLYWIARTIAASQGRQVDQW
jgi:hypothetical protein